MLFPFGVHSFPLENTPFFPKSSRLSFVKGGTAFSGVAPPPISLSKLLPPLLLYTHWHTGGRCWLRYVPLITLAACWHNSRPGRLAYCLCPDVLSPASRLLITPSAWQGCVDEETPVESKCAAPVPGLFIPASSRAHSLNGCSCCASPFLSKMQIKTPAAPQTCSLRSIASHACPRSLCPA